ncbi:unnamed protein product [Peronospora belbahrii]|uniref:Uncharacterized protein n=1 Tax=Peronospora belbahrii TaxID=622444 RepID=A0ABN8CME5_9STRA|nr:unnamed protein product [Peronospora belbahrii]
MTLENLANTLLEPKCDGLCAELHTCLLTNINAAMSRKYPWSFSYFILEDAATVPDGVVWICRCVKVDGTDWETVCNDLHTVKLLVRQLSLSVESSDLQLWQALSCGVLKKLTRQKEKRYFEGIGRPSLRKRKQMNHANIDEEEIVADSDNSIDNAEDAFEDKPDDASTVK